MLFILSLDQEYLARRPVIKHATCEFKPLLLRLFERHKFSPQTNFYYLF